LEPFIAFDSFTRFGRDDLVFGLDKETLESKLVTLKSKNDLPLLLLIVKALNRNVNNIQLMRTARLVCSTFQDFAELFQTLLLQFRDDESNVPEYQQLCVNLFETSV